LKLVFFLYWRKKIGGKAATKMLVKLTTVRTKAELAAASRIITVEEGKSFIYYQVSKFKENFFNVLANI
jgi:hypothetical protein